MILISQVLHCCFLPVLIQVNRSSASVNRQPAFQERDSMKPGPWCYWQGEPSASNHCWFWNGMTAFDKVDWIYKAAPLRVTAFSGSVSSCALGFLDEDFVCHHSGVLCLCSLFLPLCPLLLLPCPPYLPSPQPLSLLHGHFTILRYQGTKFCLCLLTERAQPRVKLCVRNILHHVCSMTSWPHD